MTYPKLSKTTFISVLFLILASLMALFYAQSQAQAQDAVPDVWVDYAIHESDVIEVKLFDGLPLRAENGRLHSTDSPNQKQIAPLLAELPAGIWQPVFETPEATLNSWRETAIERSGDKLPDLNLFFRVQLPEGMDAAAALPLFRQSALVEGAYPVAKAAPPPLPPDYETSNDSNFDASLNLNIYQRYLDAAPDGMDVRYAWEGTGGRGQGIAICDVEYGFNTHNDLPYVTLLQVPTKIYTNDYYDHGTAVLGMLGAKDNGWGATGMVSEAQFFFSPVHSITGSFDIDNAITRCINILDPGDVILLEQQTGGRNGNYVPVEWDPSVYAVIKTAVANGLIVVEAAGNGAEDLDNVFYQTAQPGHTPFTAANDSGAIIVGSAKSAWTAAPRAWNDGSSTYGDTVDLQGWGMHVLTTGYGNYYNDDGAQLSYTLFSGTSSASPMVTAAATIVQANYVAKNGSPANAGTVKQLLINTGTPQANEGAEHIGPQPDLRAAINSIWGLPNPVAPTISPASGSYNMPLQVTIDYGSAAQNSSN
ncbi:MAG: S8 family serine peptidase, partial [Anaerolineae bacterium]